MMVWCVYGDGLRFTPKSQIHFCVSFSIRRAELLCDRHHSQRLYTTNTHTLSAMLFINQPSFASVVAYSNKNTTETTVAIYKTIYMNEAIGDNQSIFVK